MFTSKYLTPSSTIQKTAMDKFVEEREIRKLTNADSEESTVAAVKRIVEKLESANTKNTLGVLKSAEGFMDELKEIRKFLKAGSEESTLNAVKRYVSAPGGAPLSYITPEGCVQLPKFVMVALGIPNGGGVVFDTTSGKKGQVTILSNEEALKLMGE